jgi:PadR family transcriptional regulator, regulatory protein PadR
MNGRTETPASRHGESAPLVGTLHRGYHCGEIRRWIVTAYRLTQPALKVLRFLLDRPRQPRSGAEIAKATGTLSGTLYPMLIRLENAGWLVSEWEEIEPSEAGRPRRRFYKLTPHGQNQANHALAELQIGAGAPSWMT